VERNAEVTALRNIHKVLTEILVWKCPRM